MAVEKTGRTAHDLRVLVGGEVREWVEGVGVLPGLEGIAPAVTVCVQRVRTSR